MLCLVFSLVRAMEFCQWTSSIRNQHDTLIVITYFSHVQGSLVLTNALHLVRLEKRRGLSKRLMYCNTQTSLSSTPVLTLHPVLHCLVDRKKRHSGFSTISLKITILNSVNNSEFSKIIFFPLFVMSSALWRNATTMLQGNCCHNFLAQFTPKDTQLKVLKNRGNCQIFIFLMMQPITSVYCVIKVQTSHEIQLTPQSWWIS